MGEACEGRAGCGEAHRRESRARGKGPIPVDSLMSSLAALRADRPQVLKLQRGALCEPSGDGRQNPDPKGGSCLRRRHATELPGVETRRLR